MRLSGLRLAVILLSASVAFAQHGGGGGGGSSGGGGGGSSGGGSHGGGGGGYSGGSAGHSSGGGGGSGGGHSTSSSGHSSGSPSSGGHGSNAAGTTRTGPRSPSTATSPIHEPKGTLAAKAAPEKRTFISVLRHPFRRPQPKTVVVPHPPFCLKGACRVCPAGNHGRGCLGGSGLYVRKQCRYPLVWSGGVCGPPMPVFDPCSALLREMQRRADRMQAAEAAEQSACAQGQSQACSEATATRQNEESGYRAALHRYRGCIPGGALNRGLSGSVLLRQRSGLTDDPFWVD